MVTREERSTETTLTSPGVRPFRIDVPDEALEDLRRRIATTNWPEKVTVDDSSQGVPPAVNQSNVKHYRHVKAVTDYKEFPGRSHYTVGEDGWEEVADYALQWAVEHAKRPVG